MPRRRSAEKRELAPDPKFGSVMVSRFINSILRRGKKGLAERIFYNAIEILNRKNENGLSIFEKAVNNVKPAVEVRPRRVGGATFQIPVEVPPERRSALAIRWIIQAAKSTGEHTMEERLAEEFFSASKKEGIAFKKREDTHRMAEANKAFAHFRW